MEEVRRETVYRLTDEEVKSHPLCSAEDGRGFYDFIMKELGIEDKRVDCRHIDVAKNIQDAWYDYASSKGWDSVTFTMTLALVGPKVNDALFYNEVSIDQDFVVREEEDE